MTIKEKLLNEESHLNSTDLHQLESIRRQAVDMAAEESRPKHNIAWALSGAIAASLCLAIALTSISFEPDERLFVEDQLLDNLDVYSDDTYYHFLIADSDEVNEQSQLAPSLFKQQKFYI